MSLTDNKKNVLTTIGAYTSLSNERELPDSNITFPSLNEDRNPLSFLVDVLNVILGSEAIKILIGELLANIVDEIEPKLKDSLKKNHSDYNSSDVLPDYFFNEGVKIPINDIDFFDVLKTDPNSDIGSLIYGNENIYNFDNAAYDSIVTGNSSYNNIKISYDELNDSFIFNANNTSTSTTIGMWKDSFIDQTTILEKEIFVANVMNNLFGTMSSGQGKSMESIINDLKTKKMLRKTMDKSLNDDIDTNDIKITDDELNEIYDDAKNIKKGSISYNICCGESLKNLDIDEFKNMIKNITESTNPDEISKIIEDAIINNTEFDDDDSLDDEIINDNKDAVLDGFFNRLIYYINFEITKMLVLSPQMVTMNLLLDVFKNEGEYNSKTAEEFINENQNLCDCIIRDINREINGFIFNLAVTSLTGLLKPVVKKIIREKILQYVNILKSLVGK